MGPKSHPVRTFLGLPARLLKLARTLYSDIFINILLDRMRIILSDLNSRRITCGGKPGNGANYSFFWEREAKGILPKKAVVFISGVFFICFFLFGRAKRKKEIISIN